MPGTVSLIQMIRHPTLDPPPGPRPRPDFSVFDPSFLARRVREHTGADHDSEVESWLERTAADPLATAAFYESLSIGFTEFFRDPLAFAVLERVLLPCLAETGRGEVRAWSAGCATGPEAWSAAMLLEDLHRAGSGRVPYRVIGTDISEESLGVATTGTYPLEALGNVRMRHLRDYMATTGSVASLGADLRARVSFSRLDLIDPRSQSPAESIYGGFDLVFCCNVLLYYRAEVRNLILGKLRRALAPGGYLVVGDSERGIVERAGGFRAIAPPATVFQKET